jgi:hypothetical protein
MLAAEQPFGGVLREHANELDFFALFGLPRGKRMLRPHKVLKVDVRRDRAPNDAVLAIVVNGVKNAIAVFNIQRLLDVYFSFKQTPHKVHSPRPQTPERGDVEPTFINERKPLTYVGLRYLQTVVFERLTAPSVASSNAVVNPTPIPFDNDNEPMREAA